ncbi:hypothetical protein [Gloeothece verrucosa]|uniref:Uncharacterized protein n=1 Tax=Gloeothece verrucosa (strain PCC 7822) TaxID=497965 RepID=E0UMK0_GLOV7|nr:hypothetical protein [Gloeothece verrucosa]ADN18180.1 conserved hypothetical protein [Gloeothece verrucosa PCC 7822]ADN18287.1 conserved hypothetical protein [Gloeothece verrucosa PCC 7822]
MTTSGFKICEVLGFERQVLMVFYTPALGYQFRVLREDGSVEGTQELYPSFEMAMKVARQSLTSRLV